MWRSGNTSWIVVHTHENGLVQRLSILGLVFPTDLPEVHLTARHHDPGQDLLLRSFTLRGEGEEYGAYIGKDSTSCLVPAET